MLADMFHPDLVAPQRLRPLSRTEYDLLVAAGQFGDEKLELLRGALVTMSPQKSPHARAVEWVSNELRLSLDRSYSVRTQLPFAADDSSEPEPDVAVVRRDYARVDHPGEALLLVEVADTSLRKDRGLKLTIYAEAKVPEYWIVDVTEHTVTVYTEPTGDRYATVATLGDGDTLRPTLLPTVALPVAELPR